MTPGYVFQTTVIIINQHVINPLIYLYYKPTFGPTILTCWGHVINNLLF